jgi:hypothetical protein
MPLYSYVVTYKNGIHIAQGSHSNFKGFVSTWATNIPPSSLPEMTPSRRSELKQKAYLGEFVAAPNMKNVWRKTIDIDGSSLTVIAVQTQQ